jgi:serine/threonine-protein kinase
MTVVVEQAQGSSHRDLVIDALISTGARASVYRGRAGGAIVAVKVYPAQVVRDEAERLQVEIDTQMSVQDPHVARLLAWLSLPNGDRLLLSNWIEGPTLASALAEPLDWERELLPMLLSLARGLRAIHAAGVVHRDVKPANILLPNTREPHAVIVDFGHAFNAGIDERTTERGLVVGSASYMAPEQCAGRPFDARVDLYAVGVLLYQALTGELPFVDSRPAVLLRRHQIEAVIPPRQRAPGRAFPQVAEDLCLWLLEKQPDRRLPTARVLAATVTALMNRRLSSEDHHP